jgi:Plant transposon protein
LVDGIYPNWAIFVKTIPHAARVTKQEEIYSAKQEKARKDIERAFGILVVKEIHILARPVRFWEEDTLRDIVYACVILHNMCCEERIIEKGSPYLDDEDHERYLESCDDPQDEGVILFGRGGSADNDGELAFIEAITNRFA